MGSVTHAERVNVADKVYIQPGKSKVAPPIGLTILQKAEKAPGLEYG